MSVGLVEGQDSREMLEIRVADTGVGIKEENRERIFERFYQVDNPDMNISDGGGGLSIVRDFVTLHDGTVNVMDNTPVGCKTKRACCVQRRHPCRNRNYGR